MTLCLHNWNRDHSKPFDQRYYQTRQDWQSLKWEQQFSLEYSDWVADKQVYREFEIACAS
jgi:hypothetical protein